MHITFDDIAQQVHYKTSRSGGSGGQNVNKVATKVELLFNLETAVVFSTEEKHRIRTKLQSRLQSEGFIQVISQAARTQLGNKEIAQQKLIELLSLALKVQKQRKPSKPSKSIIECRLENKRRQALRKISRKNSWLD
ncbi:ribosome-associated protein [bacterium A37T11]|nr:ribosome-associated protein [bacterium A37T11]